MDTQFLATLTCIGFNKYIYQPSWESIKAAYYAKYRGVEDPDNIVNIDSLPTSAPGSSASHAAT